MGVKLAQLIPVYEAAKLLSLIGEYEESARCYQHVATTFPSREVYNNAGVNMATQALSLYKKEECDYFYPFGLDEGSRLYQDGSKGGDPIVLREELLEEAINNFEKAMQLDKSYTPVYINIALTYDLIGEKEMALAMALKAHRMAKENKDTVLLANALIAEGIIQAHLNNKKATKLAFNEAMIGNERIAKLNFLVLKKGVPFHELMDKKETAEITSNAQESINEVDPSLMEVLLDDAKMIRLKSQSKERRKVKIYSYDKDGIKAIHVKHYTNPINETSFILTTNDFDGSTSRGIQLNDEMDEVIKAYGIPTKITSGINGNYFVYKQTRIIFRTNEHDRVSHWILY
ncbi:MAG: tetratricopeptide repeat protein [Flavobacteriales bacterium]|nr:tetratricopeptide repeat protein [Flavobacteriales bacterium]